MEGLGLWWNTKLLLAVCGAQKDAPALRRAHEVVRCVEAPRFLLRTALNVPRYVCDRKVLALWKERDLFELGADVPVGAIELAQGNHVLTNWFDGWPVRIAALGCDSRRNCV